MAEDNWFLSLYFQPRNGLPPAMVLNDGDFATLKEMGRMPMLMKLLRDRYFQDEKRPFLIYNGTHDIKYIDKIIIDDRYRKVLENQEVAFYFFEPLTHYLTPVLPNKAVSHIMRIDNEPYEVERIRCFELESISNWAQAHNFKKIVVYCADYKCWEHYQKLYPNIKLEFFDLLINWCSKTRGKKTERIEPLSKNIIKKFWCGAWRYEPYRHLLMSFLAEIEAIPNSNISFYFDFPNEEMKRRTWFGWKEFEYRHPALAPRLLSGNEKLRKLVPLSLDISAPVACNGLEPDPTLASKGKNLKNTDDPRWSYHESFCAIVLESRFNQPWPNISEKTINAIKNHRPFIIAGAPGTIQMLKDMGFRTFDKYWPEDYDTIINNQNRIARICEIIESINSMNIEEMRLMYKSMMKDLRYNESILPTITEYYQKINLSLKK